MVLRVRDPDGGTVSGDGVDLTSQEPYDTRATISGVLQDPHVSASSVAATLRRVGTASTTLDNQIGTDGTRPSDGVRRRLAPARALLADPRIPALDEPTAHLDAKTARAVLDDLLAAASGRSMILVTHDLTGPGQVDEVVVLRRGRVEQRGTVSELRGRPGRYAEAATHSDR